MAEADADWRGGLAPHYDFMLPGPPDDPAMRESASIWLFEDNGDFALTRVGIEAVGAVWDNHRADMSAVLRNGRAMIETGGSYPAMPPAADDGLPRILGAGPLRFECIEPYRRWRVSYDGQPVDTTSMAMIAGPADPAARTSLAFDVMIDMVTPCWVQDNTPEKLVGKSEREMDDARSMGLGYRMEHMFRGEGTLTVDGATRTFTASGSRIHRQSVRPLEGFRGHVWQSAVFPDGRAFGVITYPTGEDGSTYNEGYIYQDGRMVQATASHSPWLRGMIPHGEDVSLVLESELGTARIGGVGGFNTFKHGIAEMPGFILNQGGAHYTWDGQSAYGMVERSSWVDLVKD